MRRIFYRYLGGLDSLYARQNDPDIWVMAVIVLLEALLIGCIAVLLKHFYGISTPTFSQLASKWHLGNKWVVRIAFAALLLVINKYLFGVDERKYSKVEPLSKGATLVLTGVLLCSMLTILYLLIVDKQ